MILITAVDDLWGHEVRSARNYIHDRFCLFSEAKVDKHDVFVLIKKDVCWFDVSVDDVF